MMAVKNLHREYMSVTEGTYESWSHHESSQSATKCKEDHIQAMTNFIEGRGSPLSSKCPLVLHNFVTKQIMTPQIREDMLHAMEKGEEKYLEYRSHRLIKKNAKISETIHRSNLKCMKSISNVLQKTVKKAVKTVNITEKAIAVARDRGMSTDELLTYDIVPSPVLFTGEGFITKPDKSHLITELETFLNPTDYKYSHTEKFGFVVDVMANVHKIKTASLSDFQSCPCRKSSMRYCKFGNVTKLQKYAKILLFEF